MKGYEIRSKLSGARKLPVCANNRSKNWALDFCRRKDRGDKAIVVEIGLAVVAVVLLVVFRQAMSSFISTLITEMTSRLSGILAGTTGA